MNIIKRFAIAANQSVCLIFTGRNDLTLSGRAHIKHVKQGKSNWRTFVNAIFFWQEDHCKSAFEWEVRPAKNMYHKYKHLI